MAEPAWEIIKHFALGGTGRQALGSDPPRDTGIIAITQQLEGNRMELQTFQAHFSSINIFN